MTFDSRRPVIGFITMGGPSLETELFRSFPQGLEIVSTRVPFPEVTYARLLEMTERVPEAARILAEARPGVIAVTNFIASCIRGKEMVNLIEQATGIPAIVPATEYVAILRTMGARTIAIASCLSNELQIVEQLFFDEYHIRVGRIIQLAEPGQIDPMAISLLNRNEAAYKIAQADLSQVDAVIVDMPLFRITPQACAMLDRHPIPILTLTQVLLWSTFKKVGAPREGLYLSRFLTP